MTTPCIHTKIDYMYRRKNNYSFNRLGDENAGNDDRDHKQPEVGDTECVDIG